MNHETLFLYSIAGIAFCFALADCARLFLKRNRTVRTVGTIISIKMPNAETAKARNSKWAQVSYKADGRIYQSRNRIQVPMASQIGTPVTVRYDRQNPEKVYGFSVLRASIALLVGGVCVLAAVWG